jgi:hypothetical protein
MSACVPFMRTTGESVFPSRATIFSTNVRARNMLR